MTRIADKLIPLTPPLGRESATGASRLPEKAQRAAAGEAPALSMIAETRATTPSGAKPLQRPAEGTERPLSSGGDGERRRLLEASREFEAVSLSYLASAMRATIPRTGGGGLKGAQYYEGLVDEQLGRLLADSGHGLNLAEALSRQVKAGEGEGHVEP